MLEFMLALYSYVNRNIPRHFKEAMVRPKLKKDSLGHRESSSLANYWLPRY